MVNVAYPVIVAAVVTQAQEAFTGNVLVTHGPAVVDPTYGVTFVECGFDDTGDDTGVGATFTQRWATVTTTSRDEDGTIRFSILHLDGGEGDDGAQTCLDAVFDAAETLAALFRTGTLDVSPIVLQWTSALVDATYEPLQTDQGAAASLRFGIEYKARF